MDIFEQMVCEYLCGNGQAFVCTQFDCPWDAKTETGGSAPDFVVLDPWCNGDDAGDIIIVEVTTAYTVTGLLEKVRNRRSRWYLPVFNVLRNRFPGYAIRTLVFIRKGSVQWAQERFCAENDADVTFFALEDTAFPYSWHEQRCAGLPKRGAGIVLQP